MRASVIAFCFLLSAAPAAADYSFTGYARALDTGELLYVETHAVSAAGTVAERRVVLYRPDASSPPFARKFLEYGVERTRPAFWFEDRRSGFVESFAREARGLIVSARAGAQASTRSNTLADDPTLVVDAGFDEFVREQWPALDRGEALVTPFLVPSRLGSVNFRVRKVADTYIEGAAAAVIRLSLAGPLGWFLSDIDVTYRSSDRRLLRYRGLTNIRDAEGELLEAQIDFPEAGRGPGLDLESQRALPLVSPRG